MIAAWLGASWGHPPRLTLPATSSGQNRGVDGFWAWWGTVDWGGVVVDVGIPVAAILVPTFIAIGLARAESRRAEDDRRAELADREIERRAALADRQEERREVERERQRKAGEGVIIGLASLISLPPDAPGMRDILAEVRGRIAVYRAWIEHGDLSGDWLALQHGKGMRLFLSAMESIDALAGSNRIAPHEIEAVMEPPRRWAQDAIDTFSGWLSGHVDDEVLRSQGAEILASQTPQAPPSE